MKNIKVYKDIIMKNTTDIALLCGAAVVMCSVAGCKGSLGDYDAEGYFESTEITVSAEANGRILFFDVEEGERVRADSLLGCIDTVQLYLTKLQLEKTAESVLNSRPDVSSRIQAMEEQLKSLGFERERLARLLADGAATRKQMDDLDAQIAVLKKQLSAQELALNSSVRSIDAQSAGIGMQIAQVEDQLSKCRISSPVDGTVLTKYAEAGEFMAAGRPLFKVADMDRVYLRAYLTSGQLADVRLGQQVMVYSDYGGDSVKEYQGTVTWISDQSEFTPKNIQTRDERENLVYAIKVAVKNDGFIKLGMYGGLVL